MVRTGETADVLTNKVSGEVKGDGKNRDEGQIFSSEPRESCIASANELYDMTKWNPNFS